MGNETRTLRQELPTFATSIYSVRWSVSIQLFRTSLLGHQMHCKIHRQTATSNTFVSPSEDLTPFIGPLIFPLPQLAGLPCSAFADDVRFVGESNREEPARDENLPHWLAERKMSLNEIERQLLKELTVFGKIRGYSLFAFQRAGDTTADRG